MPTAMQLKGDTLRQIDRGKVALALDHAIRQCTLDIQDRPADDTKRVIVLQIEMQPECDAQTGALDTIGTKFIVKTKLPARRSVVYPMLPTRDGTLVFEPQSPLDPRQAALVFPAAPPATPPAGVDPQTGELVGDASDDEDDDVSR